MLEKIILPLVLSLLMFGLGMSLEMSDISRLTRRWRLILAALLSIFGVMAACAQLIGGLLGLEAALATGLLLLATCPGGMFSNMVTHSGKGNLALSLTLTVCSSLLYAVAMPAVMLAWTGAAFDEASALKATLLRMAIDIIGVVLLPLALGMTIRRHRPGWARKYEGMVRNASSVLIAAVFIALAVDQFEQFRRAGASIIVAVLLLNLAGWTLAGMLTIFFRLTKKELIALGSEHSIRQEGLGVFIAVTLLTNNSLVPPLLVNSLLGFLVSVTCIVGINFIRRAPDVLPEPEPTEYQPRLATAADAKPAAYWNLSDDSRGQSADA